MGKTEVKYVLYASLPTEKMKQKPTQLPVEFHMNGFFCRPIRNRLCPLFFRLNTKSFPMFDRLCERLCTLYLKQVIKKEQVSMQA